jgi:hypothetical protein
MISSYNAAAQTVAVGSAYTFDTNRITTGCTVGHVPGTTTFTLTKPGYYYITFNTVFTTDATGEATVKIRNTVKVYPAALAPELVEVGKTAGRGRG